MIPRRREDPWQQTTSKREQRKGEEKDGTQPEWEAARTQQCSKKQYAVVDHEKTRFGLFTPGVGGSSPSGPTIKNRV